MSKFSVIDLFSGAGGMSFGFSSHPSFKIIAAADLEMGKPSDGAGFIDCNRSYFENIGVEPFPVDLGQVPFGELGSTLNLSDDVDVLLACPPCTGYSRTNAKNHLVDDPRNSLVGKIVDYVRELRPQIVMMENARELLAGKFSHHFERLRTGLESCGYSVHSSVHMLSDFGLPQHRERALVVAVRAPMRVRTIDGIWGPYRPSNGVSTVRTVIESLPAVPMGVPHPEDCCHVSTCVGPDVLQRLKAIPRNGGSWTDLISHPNAAKLLIPSMKRSVAAATTNHFADVYGRMAWDRPAPTIKRECSHVGNGRYTHPEQDRLCTVREMALLQGFPRRYRFAADSVKNMYRHVGDAVPPLISHQLAWVANWILTSKKPALEQVLLPGVFAEDLKFSTQAEQLELAC